MAVISVLSVLTTIHLILVLPLAILSTVYFYTYPTWYPSTCAFPPVTHPTGNISASGLGVSLPPFRLLALADPQIEGDTSLWRIHRQLQHNPETTTTISAVLGALRNRDRKRLGLWLKYAQKKFDLWGNDLYLAHVYRTMKSLTDPSHVAVLGDLVGSQWIDDAEFERRGGRFWETVFKGAEKVTKKDVEENERLFMEGLQGYGSAAVRHEGKNVEEGVDWSRKLLNVVGNHDVGYSGDMTRERLERFERMFGMPNYMTSFLHPPPPPGVDTPITNPPTTRIREPRRVDDDQAEDEEEEEIDTEPPSLRLLVLNSLTLDPPLGDPFLAQGTFDLINTHLKTKSHSPHQSQVLLTHVPLRKPAGVCSDPPFIQYYPPDQYSGGVREQNHLSDVGTGMLLGWIFGLPQGSEDPAARAKERGITLTGHDHEGCDVWHFWKDFPAEEGGQAWEAVRWGNRENVEMGIRMARMDGKVEGGETGLGGAGFEGVREVTVRSMMGEYGGNAALVSAWFEWTEGRWRFEVVNCGAGTQHVWWAVHGLDLGAVITSVVLGVWHLVALAVGAGKPKAVGGEEKEKKKQ